MHLFSSLKSLFLKRPLLPPKWGFNVFRPKNEIIDTILQNPDFKSDLNSLSKSNLASFSELVLKSKTLLGKIVSCFDPRLIDFWNLSLPLIFKYSYPHFWVSPREIVKLQSAAMHAPLVLVSAHRSHLDYFLLSYVFYQARLAVPYIAAGENLSFWPMGFLFQRSGAYFMRRRFREDLLYRQVLKHYLKSLIEDGHHQEFFIEGTRSRTGKLGEPKLGLLRLLIEAFCLQEIQDDLFFVPTFIQYDAVLEAKSYAAQIAGTPKKTERIWDLFKLPRFFFENSGAISVRFSDPISLKNFLRKQGLWDRSSKPSSDQISAVIRIFADQLMEAIEDKILVSAPALVAEILRVENSTEISGMRFIQMLERLKKRLDQKIDRLSPGLKQNFDRAILDVLSRYQRRGLIRFSPSGFERFFKKQLSLEILNHCSILIFEDARFRLDYDRALLESVLYE